MAAKKAKKAGFLPSFSLFKVKDDRIPKLFGVLFLFIALYLFIAFTSHLFTWREDQNDFYNFTWEKLFSSDLIVENWLGRFGAAISNLFFYWWFGIASYIVAYLFVRMGLSLIENKENFIGKNLPRIRTSLLLMLLLSIFLEFAFGESEFPWGGAFGESVSIWMTRFVGTAGMVAFFIFALLGFVTWTINPNFHELTWTQFKDGISNFFTDLFKGRWITRPEDKEKKRRLAAAKEKMKNATSSLPAPKAPAVEEKVEKAQAAEADKETPSTPGPGESRTEKPSGEQQLKMNLENAAQKRAEAQKLTAENADLEIEEAKEDAISIGGENNASPKPLFKRDEDEEQDPLVNKEPYDPTLELSSYEYPVTPLLDDYSDQKFEVDRVELEANKDQIIETLLNYKIEITKIKATIGPTVTLYEIVPAPGVRISKIKNLEDDIALSLSALGIRIIAPIPGRGTIGIEVPNKKKQIVSLKEVLVSDLFKRSKMELPIALGKTIDNKVMVADLAAMPHLLIAGATGQGKSVGINTIIMSLLYKKHPSELKLVMIDPKKVELFPYAKLENHFLAFLPNVDEPIVTETSKVVHTLNSLLIEMEQRYTLLKKAQARNIKEYNKKFIGRRLNPENGHDFMPHIVLVIDEFADLIMTAGKEIELPIGRLAQLSRAVGIHLIIATQRPSVNIITGVIKANFPARIAYKVTSKVDSRTILDSGGADRLIGRGDMLLSHGSKLDRLQCAFVDTPEVERVIDYIAEQKGFATPFFLPEYLGEDMDDQPGAFNIKDLDDMFFDAARLIVQNQHGSTSMIQRRLKLGYNRAGRIMDQLEALGVVGPSEGSKAREVLIFDEMELERYLEDIMSKKQS